MIRIKTLRVALLLAALLTLAACAGHGSASSAKSAVASAAASASATADAATTKAINTGRDCLVTAGAIDKPSDIQYTLHPLRVTSANYTHRVFTSTKDTITKFTHCMQDAYKGHWIAIRNCVQKNPPAFGKGFFNRAFVLFVNCAAKYSGGTT